MTGKKSARQRLETALRQARQRVRAATAGRGSATINVSSRRNVIITTAVGEPGTVQVASTRQTAPIVQQGADAADKTDTTEN